MSRVNLFHFLSSCLFHLEPSFIGEKAIRLRPFGERIRLGLLRQLSHEMHPTIQGRGAFLAATARPNPHGVRDALNGVSESDFLLNEKTRQAHAMRLFGGVSCMISDGSLALHDALRLL
jgi:hypothetical protein